MSTRSSRQENSDPKMPLEIRRPVLANCIMTIVFIIAFAAFGFAMYRGYTEAMSDRPPPREAR